MRRVGYFSKKMRQNSASVDWRGCFNSASVIVILPRNYRDCRPLYYSLDTCTVKILKSFWDQTYTVIPYYLNMILYSWISMFYFYCLEKSILSCLPAALLYYVAEKLKVVGRNTSCHILVFQWKKTKTIKLRFSTPNLPLAARQGSQKASFIYLYNKAVWQKNFLSSNKILILVAQ